MNKVPFLGEIGYVPAPKSNSFGELFLIVAFLLALGTVVYFLLKPKESDDGNKLSSTKVPVLLK